MNVGTVRTAIIRTLSSISGLHFYDTVPDSIVAPAVAVFPKSIDYAHTFDAAAATMTLRLYTAKVNAAAGQNQLDNFISSAGNTSIPALLHGVTLSGTSNDAMVRFEENSYRTAMFANGATYYTATLLVDIYE